MKKHIIAAAVAAAVAVPAMAQNVTVSGLLDAGFQSRTDDVGGTKVKRQETGMANAASTSVIQFMATEDLGGGVRASAFMNQSMNSNTGALAARDTWVALANSSGELKIGRFTPGFETNAGLYSVGSNTTLSAGTADFVFGGNRTGVDTAAATLAAGPRVDFADLGRGLAGAGVAAGANNGGTIQFTSPNFSGITLVAGYGLHKFDNGAAAQDGEVTAKQTDLAANFVSGALSVGVAAVMRKDMTEAAQGTTTDRDGTSFGVSYNLGGPVVRIGHITREDKLVGAANAIIDAKISSVGFSIPMGATAFNFNYFDGKDSADGVIANQRDYTGFQVFAVHTLSKRTNIYAVYGTNDYKGSTAATTSDRRDISMGIRHSF